MASPKTRANVARVAAAAVFAAGASLAIVGTASAGDKASSKAEEPTSREGTIIGITSGSTEGSGGSIVGVAEGADSEGTAVGLIVGSSEGSEGGDEGADEGTDAGTDEGADGGTDEGADAGTDEGADAGTDEGADAGTDEGADAGTDEGGASQGGVAEGAVSGNEPEPANQGSSSGPIEQEDPTEGEVPVEELPAEDDQGGELAETGASGNDALLIIGAATMIAGGVGFRYLPRLINKNATPA